MYDECVNVIDYVLQHTCVFNYLCNLDTGPQIVEEIIYNIMQFCQLIVKLKALYSTVIIQYCTQQ